MLKLVNWRKKRFAITYGPNLVKLTRLNHWCLRMFLLKYGTAKPCLPVPLSKVVRQLACLPYRRRRPWSSCTLLLVGDNHNLREKCDILWSVSQNVRIHRLIMKWEFCWSTLFSIKEKTYKFIVAWKEDCTYKYHTTKTVKKKLKRRWYYSATHHYNVNVVQSNITFFFIFAVLVVWYLCV